MRKNFKKVNFNTEMIKRGNWNYKNKDLKPIYTKPMGIVLIDGEEHLFRHKELIQLLELYHYVDKESIKMINDSKEPTGEVGYAETEFIKKIKYWVENKLK